jgi:hypothetical protein
VAGQELNCRGVYPSLNAVAVFVSAANRNPSQNPLAAAGGNKAPVYGPLQDQGLGVGKNLPKFFGEDFSFWTQESFSQQ